MALTLLAAYDVSNDDRRARLAALLQTWGDRLQYSVFLLSVPDHELPGLLTRAREIIQPTTDSLIVQHQCATCWEAHASVGQAYEPSREVMWAVL